MTRMVPVDDSGEEYQEVIVGASHERRLVADSSDVFAKSLDDYVLGGLNPALTKRKSRELQKRRQSADGTAQSKTVDDDAILSGYDLLDVVQPPYNMDYLCKLAATTSSPHYAAIQAKVFNIVGLGYDLIESNFTRQKFDKEENPEKLDNMRRKLQNLKFTIFGMLDGFNEEDEFIETLIKVYTDYQATGNGYIEVGRTALGVIKYVGHVPASTMRIRRKRDGYVQISAEKAVFFRRFGDKTTPNPITGDSQPNEIIHLKKYSPINSYYGVPDIIPALQAVAGNEFAARFNLDYFENKAVPRYVIVIKGGRLSDKSQKNIVDFFEGNLKGQNHRTLYVPMPQDSTDNKHSFEMKPVEAGTQDASFVNYNKINLENILMAHRVPITKIAAGGDMALAAAKELDKTFKETVCRPEQSILDKKVNKIVGEFTNLLDFKLNELTLTDELERAKIDQIYLTMQAMVPNEVRARWGWPRLDGGDEVVDLKAQQQAEQRAQATDSRTRDRQRNANSTDTVGGARSAQGEGRSYE